jgi:hypothetical protein
MREENHYMTLAAQVIAACHGRHDFIQPVAKVIADYMRPQKPGALRLKPEQPARTRPYRAGDFSVGDRLWRVTAHTQSHVTITKVGRRYLYIGHGRYEIETLRGEWGGHLWLSEEHHRMHMEKAEAWREFTQRGPYNYSAPEHVTIEQIREWSAIVKGEGK